MDSPSSNTHSRTGPSLRPALASFGGLLVCCLIVALVVVTRFFILWEIIALLFTLLFAVGLSFDLTRSTLLRHPIIERNLLPAGLLLLAVLSMLSSLFEAWAQHYVFYGSAGCLLPYSDASNYVNGAKCLLTFGKLDEFTARRPLGTCLMSAVLELTGQNYQWALILLTVLAGISTFLAAYETWRAGGVAPAVLQLALCYFAMRLWLPLFLSETPGYILGSMSYTFLLAGFRLRSFPRALCGFGFLILALTARAGAMFVIPLVALYAIYFFGSNFRDALKKCLQVAGVGGALLVLSPLLDMRLAPASSGYQGNFSYSLYGIAAGGKGWTYVSVEHPEVESITSDGEKSRYIYALFWKKVTLEPGLFFSTLARSFLAGVIHFHRVLYGLIWPIPPTIPGVFAVVACCLLVLPARRRSGPWAFLLPVFIGGLISAPFLGDAGPRAFAATFPFQAGLAACAIPLVMNLVRKLREQVDQQERRNDVGFLWAEAGFAAFLFASVSLFPLLMSLKPVPEAVLSWSRDNAAGFPKEVVFYFNPASGILLGNQQRVSGVMNVPVQSVVYSPAFGKELHAADHLAAGDYLYHAFFLQESERGNIFVQFNKLPSVKPGYLKVVVRLLEMHRGAFLYHAESFTPVDPKAAL
jgi:hypothetical protein